MILVLVPLTFRIVKFRRFRGPEFLLGIFEKEALLFRWVIFYTIAPCTKLGLFAFNVAILCNHGGRLLGLFLPYLPGMRVLGHRQK